MPSLRIASIGASIASARTICTPCGSCRRGSGIRRPTSGAISTSASSAPRVSASSTASAFSRRAWSRASSVQPSQSEARKTVSICAARSPGSLGHRLAAGFQVGGGDAGGGDRVAGGAEGLAARAARSRARARSGGQRPVAVEERVVAALGVDVEGNLVAAGDQRAEADRRLGGKPGQRVVEQAVTHGPALPATGMSAPAPARRLAANNDEAALARPMRA